MSRVQDEFDSTRRAVDVAGPLQAACAPPLVPAANAARARPAPVPAPAPAPAPATGGATLLPREQHAHTAAARSAPDCVNDLPLACLSLIFGKLGPQDLCRASAVCALWRDTNRAADRQWRGFFLSRWRLPSAPADTAAGWQAAYCAKVSSLRAWGSAKHHTDSLRAHRAGIKAVRLLPRHNLVVTGSLDKTVRLWDLQLGMPLSVSRPQGGTVRAVALDAATLAAGGTDGLLRLWDAAGSRPAAAAAAAGSEDEDCDAALGPLGISSGEEADARGGAAAAAAPLFDVSRRERLLRGHIGPVSCLCLTEAALYSGSWDYSVRTWRRGDWSCAALQRYTDFVWSVAERGGLLLVSAGAEVHVHDAATSKLLRKFENLHEGHVSCVEGTHSGRLLFSGASDGLVMAHDLRMRDPSAIQWHHNAGVTGLAWEDPLLASCSADGTAVLINTEAAPPTHTPGGGGIGGGMRHRTLAPGSGAAHCVDIADQWVAVGCEEEVVRTWDFTRALEAEARAQAARAARNSRRARRRRGGDASTAAAAAVGAGGAERADAARAQREGGADAAAVAARQRSTPLAVPRGGGGGAPGGAASSPSPFGPSPRGAASSWRGGAAAAGASWQPRRAGGSRGGYGHWPGHHGSPTAAWSPVPMAASPASLGASPVAPAPPLPHLAGAGGARRNGPSWRLLRRGGGDAERDPTPPNGSVP